MSIEQMFGESADKQVQTMCVLNALLDDYVKVHGEKAEEKKREILQEAAKKYKEIMSS